MEWWGLFEDDELIVVRRFFNKPNAFDFETYLSSDYRYEIRRVSISWAR